jgi:hypothetical protein
LISSNAYATIWSSLATTNTAQPLIGWTIDGINSTVIIGNKINPLVSGSNISNVVQHIFVTLDRNPSYITISQNINILSSGVYVVDFYTCARPAFGNPTVTCSFNGTTISSVANVPSKWNLTSCITTIITQGIYELKFSFPQSQVSLKDVTIYRQS